MNAERALSSRFEELWGCRLVIAYSGWLELLAEQTMAVSICRLLFILKSRIQLVSPKSPQISTHGIDSTRYQYSAAVALAFPFRSPPGVNPNISRIVHFFLRSGVVGVVGVDDEERDGEVGGNTLEKRSIAGEDRRSGKWITSVGRPAML